MKVNLYAKFNAPNSFCWSITTKKLPETVKSYSASKVGVDVSDPMARYNTCKGATRRWPVTVFF